MSLVSKHNAQTWGTFLGFSIIGTSTGFEIVDVVFWVAGERLDIPSFIVGLDRWPLSSTCDPKFASYNPIWSNVVPST